MLTNGRTTSLMMSFGYRHVFDAEDLPEGVFAGDMTECLWVACNLIAAGRVAKPGSRNVLHHLYGLGTTPPSTQEEIQSTEILTRLGADSDFAAVAAASIISGAATSALYDYSLTGTEVTSM